MFSKLFGKYRFLVISIALFIIFDLGVLILNFYTSGKIAEQTELINLAARQSTLSQQMSKATLYIKSQKLQQWVYQSGLEELRSHYTLFGETLNALTHGGQATSTETGAKIQVDAVTTERGRALLNQANLLWSGFDTAIKPLMKDTLITDEEIQPASEFIARNNLVLFDLMTQLTDHFSHEAEAQTTLLRRAQVAGISLATINFFVILFHFLNQLRTRDRRLELKQHESDQLLASIDDGVCLVDANLRIGLQHSGRLEEIFGTNQIAGRKFAAFLNRYVTESTARSAHDFISLYFKQHVSPDLIGDLNPLKEVKAFVETPNGKHEEKYLNFSFAPLVQEDGETVLLVTVQDITDRVKLRSTQEASETKMHTQLALFSQILPINPDELRLFIEQGMSSLTKMNQVLKSKRGQAQSIAHSLAQIMPLAHRVKGDARSIGLTTLGEQVHAFEEDIAELLERAKSESVSGRDVLPLTVALKQIIENIELLKSLCERLQQYGIRYDQATSKQDLDVPVVGTVMPPAINQRWHGLQTMVSDIAQEQGVTAQLEVRGFEHPLPRDLEQSLYSMAVQLVRNSLAHGIESVDGRRAHCKPRIGRIQVLLSDDGQGNYRFVVEDDGRGFDYAAIERAIKGQHAESVADRTLSKAELLKFVFTEPFSTKAHVDTTAGRGVGLPLVWDLAKQIGAKVQVRSVAKEFTQFIFLFSSSSQIDDSPLNAKVA
ncbi:hypothetical protein GCM10008090_00960 [Arenicella chitinivorans]|uniref:HPt domain-containing protein n=1 Tax=Arenicella chitinivorans TaxID=1329800 RepID=A0A918VGS7_9GAMM|nr:ATP-binding protein [Arenicella chitinivorans]GGZ96533.1 hypothetical protein GCM10008090_00960 [Arenicella chitinivorans]